MKSFGISLRKRACGLPWEALFVTSKVAAEAMVNQVLTHISNTLFELAEYSCAQSILVEAYSPIAQGTDGISRFVRDIQRSLPEDCRAFDPNGVYRPDIAILSALD